MAEAEQEQVETTRGQRMYDKLAQLADITFALPLRGLAEIGTLSRLLFESILWVIRPPYRFRLLISAFEFIGWQSLIIVGLTGTFVGAALGLQLVEAFRRFGAENQTGTVVGLALSRELAPVFSALMISSRAGSAIATEVGSMRVSNQIDALTTMSVSPVQYLIAPRLLAAIFAVPMMALWFFVVGIAGAYLVSVNVQGLDGGTFLERVKWFVDGRDMIQLFTKASVFGVAVTLIACRQGFYADGGAAGVGQATNKAVVHSAVAILALNFVVTAFFVGGAS